MRNMVYRFLRLSRVNKKLHFQKKVQPLNFQFIHRKSVHIYVAAIPILNH